MTGEATLPDALPTEAERLRFLVRSSRELALLKRDELARRARDLLLRASGCSELSLWVRDPRSGVLYPWALGNTPVLGRRPRLRDGEGLAGRAHNEETPRFHAVIPPGAYVAEEWGGRPSDVLRGLITLPLRRAGESLGVAILLKLDSEPPPEGTLAFLNELAIQLAIAVGNARIYADATREKVQNHLLFELGTKISVSLDTGQLLEQILDLVFQVVRYDAAGIYLVDRTTQWITRQTIRGYDPNRDDAVRLKVGRGLIGWVAKTGRGVIVPDVTKDERYVDARDETRSEMVAPLRIGAEVIGAFNLESDEPDAYEDEDMELLMTFASQAAVAIERTRLHAEVLEKRRLEEEVSIGQRIQRSFLPERDPEVPNFDIAGAAYASDLVGGDYYDYVRITDGHLGVVIGDVSGKGIPAALIMASFRASLIAEVRNNYAIRTILAKVNRLLWQSIESGRFVTAIYGVLDLGARRFTYANAGHNPALLYRAASGQFDSLDPTGPLLGTIEGATYKERQTEIRPGDVLVLYTDGITEALNPANELFGTDRLKEVIRARAGERASVIVRGIRETVQAFTEGPLRDDLAVVVIRGT